MNNKTKIIMVGILTVLMVLAIQFGEKDEKYFIDIELNKKFATIHEALLEIEDMEKYKTNEELQNKIEETRILVRDFEDYVASNGDNTHNENITSMSVRIDKVQQGILNNINDNISRATQVRSPETIDVAKGSIPTKLPSKWKEEFDEKVNKLKPYEGVDAVGYELADKAYLSVRKTFREKEVELNLIQKNINEARNNLKDLVSYCDEKNNQSYIGSIGVWSVIVDNVQQNLINNIEILIKKAEDSKSAYDIKEAIDSIPDNLPDRIRQPYLERINKIK